MRRPAAILAIALLAAAPVLRPVPYNKRITFRTGEVLRLPDFALEYLGITSPVSRSDRYGWLKPDELVVVPK